VYLHATLSCIYHVAWEGSFCLSVRCSRPFNFVHQRCKKGPRRSRAEASCIVTYMHMNLQFAFCRFRFRGLVDPHPEISESEIDGVGETKRTELNWEGQTIRRAPAHAAEGRSGVGRCRTRSVNAALVGRLRGRRQAGLPTNNRSPPPPIPHFAAAFLCTYVHKTAGPLPVKLAMCWVIISEFEDENCQIEGQNFLHTVLPYILPRHAVLWRSTGNSKAGSPAVVI
jgi:hypothetical protein